MNNDSGAITAIPNVQGPGVTRLILPIAGGTVRSPLIQGEIVRDCRLGPADRQIVKRKLPNHYRS